MPCGVIFNREVVSVKHACGDAPQRAIKSTGHASIERIVGAITQIEFCLQRIKHLAKRYVAGLDMDRIRLTVHSHLCMRRVTAGGQRPRGDRKRKKLTQPRRRGIAAGLAAQKTAGMASGFAIVVWLMPHIPQR